MVSRSSATARLLPETCRGMYSVCEALGGERTGSQCPPVQALSPGSLHCAQSSAGHAAFPAGKHNTGGSSTAEPAHSQGRGLAGPQQPSGTSQTPGITSEIPAAGRFSWRRTRPSHCCTPAATGSRCWSRRGARTPRMRSALWDGAGGSGVLLGLPPLPPSHSWCLTAAQLVAPLGAVDDAIAAHGAVLAALCRLLVQDARLRAPEHDWKQENTTLRPGLPVGEGL